MARFKDFAKSEGAAIIRKAIAVAPDGVARPRHVRQVTEKPDAPRTSVSLCSVAVAAVPAWEGGDSTELDAAMASMANHIGNATMDAARRKARAA